MSIMHLAARTLCVVLLLVPVHAWSAGKKEKPEPKLTLEDVIFEPSYLTQMLGQNTLVVPDGLAGGLRPDLLNTLRRIGVTAKSRTFLLPDGGRPPILKSSIPYSFPRSLRQGKQTGHAYFLVFIGADGVVKTLHCYEFTDRMFALAVAMAVVKWKYQPATINGTPVPVVLELPAQFRGDGYDHKFNYGPDRDPMEMSPPVRDSTQPPPGN